MQNSLQSLPPELLQFIALHLATTTPNLGPPAALLPLLSVCRSLYDLLGWGKNWPFWAQIDAAKFTSTYPSYTPYDGYPYDHPSTPTGGNIVRAAHALRTRCTALSILRRGEPSAPGAARALQIAYGMLIEDEWAGDKLDWTQLDIAWGVVCTSEDSRPGKNRRQLAWANARTFALRYVRERMYDGRFGDRDPEDVRREGLDEWRTEWAHPAWRVGWPRDTDGAAAALWVLWFFEGEDTLRAEPEPLRRHIMRLLLPMVVTPFRYASALAPPHHYTVPLLPSVHASAAFALDPQGITIPTHHGPYPLYPLGAPQTRQGPSPIRHHVLPHPHRSRSRLLCAPPARLLFFARMQIGARMGVPPHLPRDRAEAQARFVAAGGTGHPLVGPTQADIHEKNARPLVRFERSLPPPSALHPLAPSAVDP
ncbi:hypothetical protein B0H14DRAFT_3420998 [Mycena olivaceomarginata]|nr:hypothetical protein B0H14DRAFT_3420998 [Mycena olivaceomarginata]